MKISTLLICLPLALGACGDSTPGAKQDGGVPIDAPKAPSDGTPAPDASCFDLSVIGSNATNDQIINACTTADKIFKDSHPALLGSDGSLPPLPTP